VLKGINIAISVNNFFIMLVFLVRHFIIQKAQTFAIHLTAHHKPLSNMGMLRPLMGTAPILKVCSLLVVVIVRLLSNMSLHSLRNAGAKLHKKVRFRPNQMLKSHKM
jgi:hypothetical protein